MSKINNSKSPYLPTHRRRPQILWHILILAIIALAFFLRLRYLTRFQFHIDEFFTLTAADFVAQSGLPLYPTGLFYDPGLPYTYLTGLLFWLFGFSEALGRWPAVVFGTLAVVTVYWLGVRLLRSPGLGVLAALWLALSLESVEWSGRARMITLAQWLGLLSVGLLWLGSTKNSSRCRLGFALSYGLTLLTHFSTVVLIPAWFTAGAVLWRRRVFNFSGALLRDVLVFLAITALALSSGIFFQPPPSPDFEIGATNLGEKTEALTGKFLQIPSDVGQAWESYSPYFLEFPHGPILALAVLGISFSLFRVVSGQPHRRDTGALFLAAIFLTVMAVLILVISPHWQRARYLLMQVQGIFLLLGAHGLGEIVQLMQSPQGLPGQRQFRGIRRMAYSVFRGKKYATRNTQHDPPHAANSQKTGSVITLVAAGGLAVLVSIPFLPPLAGVLYDSSRGWNRYDQAFNYVGENISAGEQVISMHPPAGLLYLDQSDYYLVQSSPKLIVRADDQLGDRYSGAIWLDSAEQFNQLLATRPHRVWLVTQEFWLFNSYDGYLQQQILWQMDKLWGEGGVWALAGRPGSWPLAREIETDLTAQFKGGARLAGFTANVLPPSAENALPEERVLSPGGTIRFTYFWQGNVPFGAKVMVHLRDAENNTVAQADHFIYDNKVPSSRWSSLLENDVAVRDGATLAVPPDLEPGVYRILVGFYHPETFERLGVVDDQSGENAVIIGEWVVE